MKNGSKSDEEGLLRGLSKLIKSYGVVGSSLQVSERGAGANMSVDIAAGDIYIDYLNYSFHGWSTATVNKTISGNTSGQTRIDAVVAYVDLAEKDASDAIASANPTTYQDYSTAVGAVTANETDGLVLQIVEGTPAASPVAPDSAAIQSAVGASNPYKVLAHVEVADSASSITDSEITDKREYVQFKDAVTGLDWSYLPTAEQPTYASSSTMTNPTGVDWTDYIEVGDSVSWNDGSDKLGYITNVSSTTITITGDSVANATITNFKYSKIPGKAGEAGVGSANHAEYTSSSATTTSGTFVRIPSSVTKDIKVKGGGALVIMITCQASRSSGSYQLLPQIDDDFVGIGSSTSYPTFSNGSGQYVTTSRIITGYTGGTKTISLAGRIDGGNTLTISAFYSTQIVAFELL
jgi:hypothetical protein